jgi:hypothetical protein
MEVKSKISPNCHNPADGGFCAAICNTAPWKLKMSKAKARRPNSTQKRPNKMVLIDAV